MGGAAPSPPAKEGFGYWLTLGDFSTERRRVVKPDHYAGLFFCRRRRAAMPPGRPRWRRPTGAGGPSRRRGRRRGGPRSPPARARAAAGAGCRDAARCGAAARPGHRRPSARSAGPTRRVVQELRRVQLGPRDHALPGQLHVHPVVAPVAAPGGLPALAHVRARPGQQLVRAAVEPLLTAVSRHRSPARPGRAGRREQSRIRHGVPCTRSRATPPSGWIVSRTWVTRRDADGEGVAGVPVQVDPGQQRLPVHAGQLGHRGWPSTPSPCTDAAAG